MKNRNYIAFAEIRNSTGGRMVFTAGAYGLRGHRSGENRKGDKSTRDALARILGAGEKALRESLDRNGIILPKNWGSSGLVHSVDGGMPWHGWHQVEEGIFEMAARRAGWMKAMAALIDERPLLFKRMITRIIKSPERGMNSPTNEGSWSVINFLTGDSVERWRSPGHAIRVMVRAIRRAKEILAPWEVQSIPWKVVVGEMVRGWKGKGPKRPHKVARSLVLNTLLTITGVYGHGASGKLDITSFRGFRLKAWRRLTLGQKRFCQTELLSGVAFKDIIIPVQSVEDGVPFLRGKETKIQGHTLVDGWIVDPIGRSGRHVNLKPSTLVVSPRGRTYHIGYTVHQMVRYQEVTLVFGTTFGYSYGGDTFHSPIENHPRKVQKTEVFWRRYFLRLALQAWRSQDREMKAEGVELPTDRSVLVFIQDSLDAGNCSSGTHAFAYERGWQGREFVPAHWLMQVRDWRARNAMNVALRRHNRAAMEAAS